MAQAVERLAAGERRHTMDLQTISRDPVAIYIISVLAVGLVGAWITQRALSRAAERRRDYVEKLQRFTAVRTESPQRNAPPGAKERAQESVETRFRMMKRLVFPGLVLLWGVLLGVPFLSRASATAVSVVAASVAVIIGIAAKPILENLVAGVMISFSQPIRIGDVVRLEGRFGIIEDITLAYTVIKLWDWRRYVIPNQRLLQLEFINYTLVDRWQWAYLEFWVEPDADIDRVQQIALAATEASPHRDADHPAGFWVIEMNKDGILCWVAGWVDHPMHAWSLRHDMAVSLIKGFKEHGIRTHLNWHSVEADPAYPAATQSVQASST